MTTIKEKISRLSIALGMLKTCEIDLELFKPVQIHLHNTRVSDLVAYLGIPQGITYSEEANRRGYIYMSIHVANRGGHFGDEIWVSVKDPVWPTSAPADGYRIIDQCFRSGYPQKEHYTAIKAVEFLLEKLKQTSE